MNKQFLMLSTGLISFQCHAAQCEISIPDLPILTQEEGKHQVYHIHPVGNFSLGQFYIGVTKRGETLHREHVCGLQKGEHTNDKMQTAYDDGFEPQVTILAQGLSKQEAYRLENQLRTCWFLGWNERVGSKTANHFTNESSSIPRSGRLRGIEFIGSSS